MGFFSGPGIVGIATGAALQRFSSPSPTPTFPLARDAGKCWPTRVVHATSVSHNAPTCEDDPAGGLLLPQSYSVLFSMSYFSSCLQDAAVAGLISHDPIAYCPDGKRLSATSEGILNYKLMRCSSTVMRALAGLRHPVRLHHSAHSSRYSAIQPDGAFKR